jgi:Holliday junction resolvase RusA-like endonuclease
MRSVQVRVDGMPPKKDGAFSMWNKPLEVKRIRLLRLVVAEQLKGAAPFARNISLHLECHVGPSNTRTTGDLDNFLTGICDALMACDKRVNVDETFEEHIGPQVALGIVDDSQVVEITARTVIAEEPPHYFLTIAGEP